MKDLFKKFGLDINKFKTGEYEGDIDISSRNLLGLVEFGKLGIKKVTGDFSCSNNKITSLEYCPNNIGGYFDCSNNKISSVSNIPHNINYFDCRDNKIVELSDTFCFDVTRMGCDKELKNTERYKLLLGLYSIK